MRQPRARPDALPPAAHGDRPRIQRLRLRGHLLAPRTVANRAGPSAQGPQTLPLRRLLSRHRRPLGSGPGVSCAHWEHPAVRTTAPTCAPRRSEQWTLPGSRPQAHRLRIRSRSSEERHGAHERPDAGWRSEEYQPTVRASPSETDTGGVQSRALRVCVMSTNSELQSLSTSAALPAAAAAARRMPTGTGSRLTRRPMLFARRRTSSTVDRSSPSETSQIPPTAAGCTKTRTSRSQRFHRLTRLRRLRMALSGSGQPRSTQRIRRRKFAPTPGPYTSGGRTITVSRPVFAATARRNLSPDTSTCRRHPAGGAHHPACRPARPPRRSP